MKKYKNLSKLSALRDSYTKFKKLRASEASEEKKYYKICVEVAYFSLSDKQLYVNLDKLLEGPRAILPPPPYKIIGGPGPCCPPPPVPTPMD